MRPLNKEEIEFIKDHIDDSVEQLSLSKNRPANVDFRLCLDSIYGNQKIREKIPEWGSDYRLLFPYRLSLEQCSSQIAAEYKCSIINNLFPDKKPLVADITGGMGADSYFISKISERVLYIERDTNLCDAAANNFKVLKADNIEIENINSTVESLGSSLPQFAGRCNRERIDIIFADPARRDKNCDKVIRLEDYEPNILELMKEFGNYADYLLIKVSPMADIKRYIKSLNDVGNSNVYVLSIDNECKELLFLVKLNSASEDSQTLITAVNLCSRRRFKNSSDKDFEDDPAVMFRYSDEDKTEIRYCNSTNFKYLYEPNKSVLKSACFKTIAERYNLSKIAPSTHLYFGDSKIKFPGKCFKVIEHFEFGKKSFKAIKERYPAASVTSRNLPVDSNQLKKILGVKESSEIHLFAYSLNNGNRYITATLPIVVI